MASYRDYLTRRSIRPVRIERTEKKPGDVVLQSWAKPVQIVAR